MGGKDNVRRILQVAAAGLIVGLLATTATAQPYSEAPMLAARVAAGELPPVEERLPDQPFVLEPVSEVGVYGGTFNVFALDNFPWNALTEEPARGAFPLRMTLDGKFLADIARDYEFSEDHKRLTLFLRPGMQWSNGDPFTSADFVFKFEQMSDDGWQAVEADSVTAPNEHTVVFEWNDPRPRAILDMIHWRGGEWTIFNPSNWLSQWHLDFNEEAEALAAEEGFDSWEEAFKWHYSWEPLNDTNKPTTQPWMPQEFTTTARVYERNPYFHQVDTAGQQLPYVDRIVSQIVNPETYNLNVIAGEADLAYTFTNMENFTLYKENEDAGNYVVNTIPGYSASEVAYNFNMSHPDPVRRELYHTAEFRQALSIAIDRDEINDLLFQGLSVPRQWTITSLATYYEAEWGESFGQYDPELANSMLDDIGLTERNSAGIRLDSAGDPLVIVVEYPEGSFSGNAEGVHELVREYWADIGIDMQIRPQGQAVWRPYEESMEWDMVSNREEVGEMYGFLRGGLLGFTANNWELWRDAKRDIADGKKTLEDFQGGVLPGEEPPAELNALFDLRDELQGTVFGSAEYTELSKQYFGAIAEGTYRIGTVGETPLVFISRPNIGNLLDRLPVWAEWGGDLNYYGAQWFYKP
jgi:peptide/nickel transport system substrate-binding protein